MATTDDIPIAFLRECFIYDSETGALFWRERPLSHFKSERGRRQFAPFIGKRAGCIDGNGYVSVTLTYNGFYRRLYGHRIILALTNNRWPDETDHWDGIRNNNRIDNLRDTDTSGNAMNRHFHRRRRATILLQHYTE